MSSTQATLPSSFDLKLPSYLLFCVTISSLGFFCNGWVTGSPNLPGQVTHACTNGLSHTFSSYFPDCLPMSDALWGFAVASFCIGGLVGSLNGGYLQTKFGRKRTITFNSLGFIIGAILISCATNTAMFIVGRIFCGYACGLGSLAIPIYIGEISTIRARGMLGAFNQGMIVSGILVSSCIGLPFSTVPLWRVNYAIVVIPAIVQLIAMPFCLESPRYLISINRIVEARLNLQRLRPNSNIEMEFYGMIEGQLGTEAATATSSIATTPSIDKMKNADDFTVIVEEEQTDDTFAKYSNNSDSPMNFIQIFRDSIIRRIAIIVILLHALQQLIGINAVMYYSTTMFDTVFHSSDMSKYMAIVTTVVNFISTAVSILLIERTGRRTLLLLSSGGACIFLILLVIGYVYNIGALLVVSIFAYVFSFAVGMGPIPWILISELAPQHASSSVGSLATCINWSMNFLIGQCFPVIFARIHGYSFAIFSVIALIIVLFVYFFIPETKGRSLEEIANEFK
jgi:MFS family permease